MKRFLLCLAFVFVTPLYGKVPVHLTPKEIVLRYFELLGNQDFENLKNLIDEDVVWYQPGSNILSGVYVGKDHLMGLFQSFFTLSQGTFRIDEVQSVMENGDLAVAIVHFSANIGVVSMNIEGVDMMRVRNGKIVEVSLFSSDQDAEDTFWNIFPHPIPTLRLVFELVGGVRTDDVALVYDERVLGTVSVHGAVLRSLGYEAVGVFKSCADFQAKKDKIRLRGRHEVPFKKVTCSISKRRPNLHP